MTQYNANNVPASLTSSTDMGVTSAILNTALVSQLHPLYKWKVVSTYGKSLLTSYIEMYGANSTIPSMEVRHEEQDRFQFPLISAGSYSGAAGASVNVTVTAGSLANGTKSPVTEGFTVMFKDGGTARVQAVLADNQYTLAPWDSTYAISVVSGTNMTFFPARFVAEGSLMGNSSYRFPPVEFRSYMNTIRMDEEFTDEVLFQFDQETAFYGYFNPLTGQTENKYYPSALGAVETQFRNAKELWALNGQVATNATLTGAGLRGTGGIIPTTKSYGTTVNYTGALGLQISDIDQMIIALTKNKAGDEYMVFGGKEFQIMKDKMLKDFFPNGALTYAAFNNDKDAALAWGFKSLTYSGYTFHFGDMEIFNDPSYLGASGFPYIGEALLMPAKDVVGDGIEGKHIEILHPTARPTYEVTCIDGTGIFQKGMYKATNSQRAVFSYVDTMGVRMVAAKQFGYIGRI